MITENMQLDSTRDAKTWAAQFGLECEAQEQRVADLEKQTILRMYLCRVSGR